jgi:hypothetical protein
MTFDFSNVRAREVQRSATSLFTFYRLEGQPTLEVKPATEANPSYMRAMLKGSKEQMRRLSGGDLSPEVLEENRSKDRKLFPEHVVVGWPKAPLDAKGERVPFSKEACAAFLAAVPADMFNELRNHCSTNDNFRPAGSDELTPVERDDLVGN